MKPENSLEANDLVLVFCMAKAGLGHLRVTDALYHGLPEDVSGLLLGVQDESIEGLHRFATVHPWTRAVGEFIQRGWPQDVFTYFYRDWLRHHTNTLKQQVETILDQQLEQPRTLLVVATHFGLAHQMAVVKEEIAKERGVRVVLVVVVTDDSPQHLWAVGGADLTFVPSERTRNVLEQYHKDQKLAPTQYIVAPYPVSQALGRPLSQTQFAEKRSQADKDSATKVRVVVPISGAAVQLSYFDHLVRYLSLLSKRWEFYIISKQSNYTRRFLNQMMGRNGVELIVSRFDREVVNLYERLYQRERILVEVTKPSEQAFKALIPPRSVGGPILMFSAPVGRQEHDNINFLARHDLIPDKRTQESLWLMAQGEKTKDSLGGGVKAAINGWRGMRLPQGSKQSAQFMMWSLNEGIFAEMTQFRGYRVDKNLSDQGVKIFWEKVSAYLAGLNA